MKKRMAKGQFSLRDFRDQLLNVMNAGSISSMMGMMPAGVNQMLQNQNPEDMTKGFRKIICLMDSMTNDELDGVFRTKAPNDPKSGKKIRYTYEKGMTHSRLERLAKVSFCFCRNFFQGIDF